ncbi:MAG: mannonate dehydratase [Bacteroidetes bacterium]|nr:mannonate dehydratase [Bacteroidota bacterium]MDA1120425.1 mannonate dehydratase [Bacteroidota bacterium]
MKQKQSRRQSLKTMGALAMAPMFPTILTNKAFAARSQQWPIKEGPNTPKLCLGASRNGDEKMMRMIKQIGVDYVLMGGPPQPWTEESLSAIMDRYKANGLNVINMMIGGFPNAIYGRDGRDEEIEMLIKSLKAAGNVGLPVVEYNFYAYRLTEGYYEVEGRGGASYTGYNYDKVKDLPPMLEIGTHKAEALWANLTYLLKAIIPVAEAANVRMALHPNDPPIPISRGNEQIMASFDDWKRLVNIVDSPSNGMTYHSGVTSEINADPVEVCKYLGSRDRINHVHYRNVIVNTPVVDYLEVFPDEGKTDMFAVMKELVNQKFKFGIYPEHPRLLDYDRDNPATSSQYPGGGGYAGYTYNVAYARAMMQAALNR